MPKHSPPRHETRPAKQEDESFLYSCYQRTMRGYIDQTWGWDEEFQRMSFIEHLPWQRFQVITIDHVPIGGACIAESRSSIDLEMMFIDPRSQRKGIGSEFLTDLLGRARKECQIVRLRVLKVNPAKALYQRLGFVKVSEDPATVEMQAE
jgi:GNAT superfamily N-acetyltransferase